jgi:long-chain fatty acid transport protein
MNLCSWVLGCVGAVSCLPGSAYALGVRIPNQDPAAIARGNAFAATADNPSAMYYNPAGITQLEGQNVQIGSLFYLNIYAEYESPSGSKTENEHEIIPVPELHYTYQLKGTPLSFGLGVFAPFGLSMKWPNDAPFATAGLEGQLTYVTAHPVVALKVSETLSIAAGPTFNASELEVRQGILNFPGARLKFKGDDVGFGGNVGILWQPWREWSFGLTYKSPVRLNYDGTATLRPSPPLKSFSSSATLDFPQIIAGGVSFRPNRNWNFEFDVDWTDWHTADALAIDKLPTRPLDWHSSFFYEVGATRYLSHGYFVSAGYFFSGASTSERYYIPSVPDTDLHVASLGGGFRGAHWSWAAAFQLIGGGWRTVENSADPTANGKYRLFTPTLSVSGGYHF